MGDYFDLYAQQLTDAGWVAPPEIVEIIKDPWGKYGCFASFRPREVLLERLFLGANALLELRKELPADMIDSELYRQRIHGRDYCFCGWIPFGDLLVDQWSESYLFVAKTVPVQLAPLFEDGSQPFPRQALLDAGQPEHEVDDMQAVAGEKEMNLEVRGGLGIAVVDAPIYQWERGPDVDGVTRVTWRVDLTEFLGEWLTSTFRMLHGINETRELRILCLFSG